METMTTLVGILFLLAFGIPVLYVVVKQFSSKKQVLNLLQNEGKNNSCQFTDYEIINKAVLALDSNKKIFLGVSQHQLQSVVLPISQIRKVQLFTDKNSNGKTSRIRISLVGNDNNETNIYTFDAKKDNVLQEQEYEYISRVWVQKIASLI